MGFIIAIVVVFVLINLAVTVTEPPKYTGKSEKKFCPPHEWIYGEDGFLVCEDCQKKPGYSGR